MGFNAAVTNRPFKFGSRDRREFIVQDSEVSIRIQNDASGNPIYIGRAKVGTAETASMWQIQFLEYDGNGFVDSITWPQDPFGNASSNYEFAWDQRAAYTYS